MSERDYLESVALTDIYADGIADVELLGDNVRLIYFTWESGQKVMVAKIVGPLSATSERCRA